MFIIINHQNTTTTMSSHLHLLLIKMRRNISLLSAILILTQGKMGDVLGGLQWESKGMCKEMHMGENRWGKARCRKQKGLLSTSSFCRISLTPWFKVFLYDVVERDFHVTILFVLPLPIPKLRKKPEQAVGKPTYWHDYS